MYLYIESVKTNCFSVSLIAQQKVLGRLEVKEDFSQQEKLLTTIDQLLNNFNCQLDKLQGIVVATGPGSFSALRIGVSTANTLAQSLNIPVWGCEFTEGLSQQETLDMINKIILASAAKGFGLPVLANYGREPNITYSHK